MDPFAPKFYSPIQTNFTTCEHSFNFVHTFISFQDLYRILLEAESEGILDDLDMTKNGFLILNQRNVSIIEVISWLQTYPFLNICISFQGLVSRFAGGGVSWNHGRCGHDASGETYP